MRKSSIGEMDPFGRNFLRDEEDARDWSEEERQYSSDEDDIDEIEQALLQRIHYAEDYQEDSSPEEEEGNRSPRHLVSNDTFPNIKVTSIKRVNVELGNTFPIKVPITVSVQNSDATEIPTESLDVAVKYESNESSKKVSSTCTTSETINKKLASAHQDAEESYVSAISIDSDSEQDSKYKSIPKSKLKSEISGGAENSVIEISSDSRDEEGRLPRISSAQSKDEVEAISLSSSDSDVQFIASKVLEIAQEGIATDKPPPSSGKRLWSKSAGVSDDGSGALSQDMPAKKVKLKRRDVSELRQILDVIREEEDLSSEGDLSGAMVIESHSEDEALDVHFTNLGEGRYYQSGGNLYCYKCKRSGHKTQDCPNQKKTCILCGTKGHNDRQCSERLCFICTEVGHQAKDCTNKKFRYMTCHRCSMKGHSAQLCPDRWRQYHLTTEPGNIIRFNGPKSDQSVSVNGKVYCYNCSLEGHFGHECMEEPMDRYAPLILPYVVKYDFIPRRFWNIQMDHFPPLTDTMSKVNPQEEEKADFRLPHSGSIQGKEANRKRKLTEEEYISIRSKKCRLKTNEEKEQDQKMSILPKKERQRIKRQRYEESLDQEEVLHDYERTNSYIQKGGHVLRKRDRFARRQYVLDEQSREIQQNNLPQKTKERIEKRKEKKLRKKLKRQQDKAGFQELKRQYQEQKKQDGQQQVTLRPSQELFEKDLFGEESCNFDSQTRQNNLPQKTKEEIKKRKEKKMKRKLKRRQDRAGFQELKRQYQEHKKLDRQQQVAFRPSQELFEKDLFGEEDHNFDSQKDLGHSKGAQSVKAKNNRRRQRRREVSEADVYKQFKRKLPKDIRKPVLEPQVTASSTSLSKNQKRKQRKLLKQANDKLYHERLLQAHHDQKEWKRQQRTMGQRFMSDKGFRVEPRY